MPKLITIVRISRWYNIFYYPWLYITWRVILQKLLINHFDVWVFCVTTLFQVFGRVYEWIYAGEEAWLSWFRLVEEHGVTNHLWWILLFDWRVILGIPFFVSIDVSLNLVVYLLLCNFVEIFKGAKCFLNKLWLVLKSLMRFITTISGCICLLDRVAFRFSVN